MCDIPPVVTIIYSPQTAWSYSFASVFGSEFKVDYMHVGRGHLRGTLRHKTTETTVGFVSVAGTMWPKKKTKSTEPPGESVSNGGTYAYTYW